MFQHLRTTSVSHDVWPVSLPRLLGSAVRQVRAMLPYTVRNVLMFALKVRRLEMQPAVRVAVNKVLLLHCPDGEQTMVPALTPPSVYCHTIVSVPFAPSHVTSLLDESMHVYVDKVGLALP